MNAGVWGKHHKILVFKDESLRLFFLLYQITEETGFLFFEEILACHDFVVYDCGQEGRSDNLAMWVGERSASIQTVVAEDLNLLDVGF